MLRKKIWKIFLKIIKWLAIGLFVSIVGIVIFSQTEYGKKIILDNALCCANKKIPNHFALDVKYLDGNIFQTIELNKGSLRFYDSTMFSFEKIKVEYSLCSIISSFASRLPYVGGLFRNGMEIESVIFNSPKFNCFNVDSLSNIKYLFSSDKKDEKKDISSVKHESEIILSKLVIENGGVSLYKELNENPIRSRGKISVFDSGSLDVKDINCELSAVGLLSKRDSSSKFDLLKAELKKFCFNTNSDLCVKSLSLDFTNGVKRENSSLNNLRLRTEKSEAEIPMLNIYNYEIFDGFDKNNLAGKKFDLAADFKKIDFCEADFFTKIGYSGFGDSLQFKLNISHDSTELNLNNAYLKYLNSEINLSANFQNLPDLKKVKLDSLISIKDISAIDSLHYTNLNLISYINGPEIDSLVRRFPKLDSLPEKLKDNKDLIAYKLNLSSSGKIDSINVNSFSVNSNKGNIIIQETLLKGLRIVKVLKDTTVKIKFASDSVSYKGHLATDSVNIGRIFGKKNLNSCITLAADFEGKRWDKTVEGNINFSANNSFVNRYDAQYFKGDLKFNFKSGNIEGNIKASSSMGNVSAIGKVNLVDFKVNSYNVRGVTSRLDIGKIADKPNLRSNINTGFSLIGKGIKPNELTGEYKFNLQQSKLANISIPATPLNLTIKRTTPQNGVLTLSSNLADLRAEGSLDYEEIAKVFEYNLTLALEKAKNKFVLEYTGKAVASLEPKNLKTNFYVITKDSTKLNALINQFGINFSGTMDGEFLNNADSFNFCIDLNETNFWYGKSSNADTAEFAFLANTTHLDFTNNYNTGSNTHSLKNFGLNIFFEPEKFSVSSFKLNKFCLNLKLDTSNAEYKISTGKNFVDEGYLAGNIDVRDTAKLIINTVRICAPKDNLETTNINKIVLKYDKGTVPQVTLDTFRVQRDNLQAAFTGNYTINENTFLNIKTSAINERDINKIVNTFKTNTAKFSFPVSFNARVVEASYTGNLSLANPVVEIKLDTTLVYLNKSAQLYSTLKTDTLGKVSMGLYLKDSVVKHNIKVFGKNGGDLTIAGDVHTKGNPLKDTSVYSKDSIMSSIFHDAVSIRNLKLDYLKGVAGDYTFVDGILSGNASIDGCMSKVDIDTKDLKLEVGSIFLPLNGMKYMAKLNFSTTPYTKSTSATLELYNTNKSNYSNPFVISTDPVKISNLHSLPEIRKINYSAYGSIAFLDETALDNELGFEGKLVAEIYKLKPLIFNRDSQTTLTGEIHFTEVDLKSRKPRKSGYSLSDDFIYGKKVDIPQDTGLSFMDDVSAKVILDSKDISKIAFNIAQVPFTKLYGGVDPFTLVVTYNEEKDKKINTIGEANLSDDSYLRLIRNFAIDKSQLSFDGLLSKPYINLNSEYTKNIFLPGSTEAEIHNITVGLTSKGFPGAESGKIELPPLSMSLRQKWVYQTRGDIQEDAASYLFAGKNMRTFLNQPTEELITSSLLSFGGTIYSMLLSEVAEKYTKVVHYFGVDYAQLKGENNRPVRKLDLYAFGILPYNINAAIGYIPTEDYYFSFKFPGHLINASRLNFYLIREPIEFPFKANFTITTGWKISYKLF